jgi:hypothetical protein
MAPHSLNTCTRQEKKKKKKEAVHITFLSDPPAVLEVMKVCLNVTQVFFFYISLTISFKELYVWGQWGIKKWFWIFSAAVRARSAFIHCEFQSILLKFSFI